MLKEKWTYKEMSCVLLGAISLQLMDKKGKDIITACNEHVHNVQSADINLMERLYG